MNKCVMCGKGSGKGRTCGNTCRSVLARATVKGLSVAVDSDATLAHATVDKPANFGQPDCQCYMCRTNRTLGNKNAINHEAWKPANQLDDNEINRVALPGDVDYVGVCKQVDGKWLPTMTHINALHPHAGAN